MNRKQTQAHILEKHGSFNMDILAGWEAGIAGKQKIKLGSKRYMLLDRQPPEHFFEEKNQIRLSNWRAGKKLAEQWNKSYGKKTSYFSGFKPDGTHVSHFLQGHVARGPVVTRMAKNGVCGDVHVTYQTGGIIVAEHRCGI